MRSARVPSAAGLALGVGLFLGGCEGSIGDAPTPRDAGTSRHDPVIEWAFIAPVRPELPAVKQEAWVRDPIDAFVLSKLEGSGLAPSTEADKRTLIRRASLDA